ncbi:MAG: amino acid ABC transporter permease [Propionibacteriaceae bacterium]|nr:amino acid ABC transporter permease [Propionibacteriaceae bacterium]
MDGFVELFTRYNLLAAFGMTLVLTIGSAIGSLIIGTIVAIMRVSPVPFMQRLGAFYVNVVRNTPLTLIVAFCALGFYFGMNVSPLPPGLPMAWHMATWGIIALSVYHAAFVTEALRSGVNTVPQGQAEAARAIGLDFGQSLREVVLPQAFRGAIAPLGNTLIALTKNTTVVATIGVAEASLRMREMIENRADLIFLIFGIIAFGFVLLTLPTGIFFTHLSRKLAVQR